MFEKILLKIIKFYQNFISPGLSKNCRFWPSCSEYFYLAIKKYGTARGLLRGAWRLFRCYPWCRGGIDLP